MDISDNPQRTPRGNEARQHSGRVFSGTKRLLRRTGSLGPCASILSFSELLHSSSATLTVAREACHCMVSITTSLFQQRADQRRQKDIGRQLKRLYADIVAEPTPGSLLLLLENADLKRKT